MSGIGSQTRKERFEEQLKALQNDISKLSQKLASPNAGGSKLNAFRGVADGNGSTGSHARQHSLSGAHSQTPIAGSILNSSDIAIADGDNYNDIIFQLRQELQTVKRERDSAMFNVEQANIEIEGLRSSNKETGKLRIMYDQLKQEYEALRASYESSERIRKQQKDLIHLLQRSNAAADSSNASVASSIASFAPLSVASDTAPYQIPREIQTPHAPEVYRNSILGSTLPINQSADYSINSYPSQLSHQLDYHQNGSEHYIEQAGPGVKTKVKRSGKARQSSTSRSISASGSSTQRRAPTRTPQTAGVTSARKTGLSVRSNSEISSGRSSTRPVEYTHRESVTARAIQQYPDLNHYQHSDGRSRLQGRPKSIDSINNSSINGMYHSPGPVAAPSSSSAVSRSEYSYGLKYGQQQQYEPNPHGDNQLNVEQFTQPAPFQSENTSRHQPFVSPSRNLTRSPTSSPSRQRRTDSGMVPHQHDTRRQYGVGSDTTLLSSSVGSFGGRPPVHPSNRRANSAPPRR